MPRCLAIVVIWIAAALGMAACDRMEPSFVVNESGAPVTIVYTMRGAIPGSGRCRIESIPPKIAAGSTEDSDWNDLHWVVVQETVYDPVRCQISFSLPEGHTALVDEFASCGDVEKLQAKDPRWYPRMDHLSLEGKTRKVSLEGIKVAAAFEKSSWRGTCTLVYK